MLARSFAVQQPRDLNNWILITSAICVIFREDIKKLPAPGHTIAAGLSKATKIQNSFNERAPTVRPTRG